MLNKKIIALLSIVTISSFATTFQLKSNGLSHIYFPIDDDKSKWYIASGSPWHKGSDTYADDWNLKSGYSAGIESSSSCDRDRGAGVISSFTGTVILADKNNNVGDYGKEVIVQSSENSGFAIRYAHLDSVNVSNGDTVKVGTPLGTVGDSGTDCAHLHLVLYQNLNTTALNRLKSGHSPKSLSGSADIFAAKFISDATTGNNGTTQSSEVAGIFDGAGSIINPKGRGYGQNYDIAKMYPHGGTGSTVVFQWLYDAGTCSQLDISSQYDIGDVVIKSKRWDKHLTEKAFKVKLNEDSPITMKRPNSNPTWITFAVTTTTTIPYANLIKAECKTSNDRFKKGTRSDINEDLVDVTHNYFWTGTGSIISSVNRAFNPPYGMTKDLASTFKTKNSLTSFQWLKKGTCNKLKLSASNGTSSSVKGVHIKEWDAQDWGESKCNSLPCTLNPSTDDFFVIKVKSSPDAISSGQIQAECVQ